MLEIRRAHRFCAARDWKGDRLRRYRAARLANLDLVPATVRLEHALVVDVGANDGGWSEALLTAEPTARVIAVEPNPGPRARLEHRVAGDPRVRVEPRPLSAAPGTVEFHITGHSHNSSLLAPRAPMQELYGDHRGWSVTEILHLEATTVDELTGGEDVGLLKIDVQGAEPAVLAGAADTLTRTSAVLLEVLFVSHYEGGAEFGDVHQTMRDHEFSLVGMSTPMMARDGRALWADACYLPGRAL